MTEDTKGPKKGTIFGGIGLLGLLALKFKAWGLAALKLVGLLKVGWLMPSAVSMLLSIGVFGAMYGWSYGIAVVLLIFIHEMGHWIWMKAGGFEPKAPMFIPGIGAYVAMTKMPPNEADRAWVAFAGPLIGGIGSAVLYWAGVHTDNRWMMAAGNTGFFLNLAQLLPARPLDGGFVVQAVSRWLLIPGTICLLLLGLLCQSPLLLLIAVISVVGLFSTFGNKKKKDAAAVPRGQRWTPRAGTEEMFTPTTPAVAASAMAMPAAGKAQSSEPPAGNAQSSEPPAGNAQASEPPAGESSAAAPAAPPPAVPTNTFNESDMVPATVWERLFVGTAYLSLCGMLGYLWAVTYLVVKH